MIYMSILRLKRDDSGVQCITEPFVYSMEAGMQNDFIKQPAEKFPISIDFTNRLPSGLTISTVTLAALDLSTNSDVTTTIFGGTSGTVSGNKATGTVRAGTNGHAYKLTITATLSDSSILEEDLNMSVVAQ